MSFYSDASLVLIPSGYKDQKIYCAKPTDGSADLTFSRASSATRVQSDGLIEKVRTNLVTYSEQLDNAAWTKGGVGTFTSAVTAGFTDPTGGTNAQRWLATIATTSDRAFVRQLATLTNGIPYNVSFWVKSNTGSNQDIYFMFQGGAVQATTATTSWQRISYSATTATTSVLVGIEAKDLAIDVLIYGFQLEVGDVTTDYIETTTAAVSVGPVSGLPRLDYLNSSCPRLLLEGQRTNLCLWSENFDNAGWNKENATITANSVISPDGYTNADTLADNSTSGRHRVFQTLSATSGTSYTFSVFVKKNSSGRFLILNAATLFNARAVLSLDTLEITNINGTGKVEDYGNGWYRFSVTGTATATASTVVYIQMQNTATDVTYVGDGSSFYLWGAMLEQGSYASSYLNTLSTSVTRVADAASKTGISSLIGQTEGVLFVDFVPLNDPVASTQQWLMFLGSGGFYIAIHTTSTGKIRGNVANSTDQCVIDTTYSFVAGTRYKCALAYKANDFAFYVNGVLIGTDTSGTIPAVSTLQNNYNATAANSTNAGLNQMLLFKTRLPNSDLATLTSL